PEKNGKSIRPLLPFSRKEIQDYAHRHRIKWREDASNASDNYLRNRIRHHILPPFEEENPDFLERFSMTQNHLRQAARLIDDYMEDIQRQVVRKKGKKTYFDIERLKKYPHIRAVIFQLFKPYGFSAW